MILKINTPKNKHTGSHDRRYQYYDEGYIWQMSIMRRKLNPKWSITLRLTGVDADNLFKKLS